MKKITLLLIALLMAFVTDAKPKQNQSAIDLRIGSYNVWAHYARAGLIRKGKVVEARSWENSRSAVADLIVKLDCDILGMQEVTDVCRDDLKKLVKKSGGKKYDLWWVNTYPEGHKNVVGNAVFCQTAGAGTDADDFLQSVIRQAHRGEKLIAGQQIGAQSDGQRVGTTGDVGSNQSGFRMEYISIDLLQLVTALVVIAIAGGGGKAGGADPVFPESG